MRDNRKKLGDCRVYAFGNNKKFSVLNGLYLPAHILGLYEQIYGPLVSVTYRGKTVMADNGSTE